MQKSAKKIGAAAIGSAMSVAVVLASAQSAIVRDRPGAQSRVARSQRLPSLDGAHLDATVVEVTYPPGGANATHRHPCPVMGYVLEGALRMQVKGKAEITYKPGDTFYESPSDVHLVSANASQDKPARFLAYFVCDRRTPLSVPIADTARGGQHE